MLALLLDLKHTLKYYRLKPNSISQNPWTQKAFRELKISGSSSFNIIKTNSRHSRSPLEEGVQTAQPEVWSKERISTSLAINLSMSYSCFRVLCSLCYLEALKQFLFHFFFPVTTNISALLALKCEKTRNGGITSGLPRFA